MAMSIAFTIHSKAQETIHAGKIVCLDEAVDFAYLLNTRTQTAVESNHGGLFKIEAQPGDTLKFRCLGYNDSLFVVPFKAPATQTYQVSKQTYALDEITVNWFYSYAAFKRAFLNLKLDDKDKPFKYDINLDMRELAVSKKLAPGGTGFSIPVASLTGMGLAYRTKDERRALELAQHEETMERYNRLISHVNIADFTRLKGPQLDSFIVYLRTRANINPALDDYDMMAAVKLAFLNYTSDKKMDIDSTFVR